MNNINSLYRIAIKIINPSHPCSIDRNVRFCFIYKVIFTLLFICSSITIIAQEIDWQLFEQKKSLLTGTWTQPPQNVVTQTMTQGPILGNGDAAITCNTGTLISQQLLIAKSDFITDDSRIWGSDSTNTPWDPVAFASKVEWLTTERILDPIPLPIGGINISVNAPSGSGYLIEQDILSAQLRMTTATNPQVKIINWLDSETNLLVSELTTQSVSPVSITVETFAKNDDPNYAFNAGVSGKVAWAMRQTKTGGITRWTTQGGISTKILGAKALVSKVGSSKSKSTFFLVKGKKIYVLTYISGGRPNKTNLKSVANLSDAAMYLNALSQSNIVNMYHSTQKWWKNYWTRSFVDLNDDLMNKYYYGAQYELGSSIRVGKVCPGLYGHWITTDSAKWHGDIHMDYNGQAPFYGVCSSNRPEMMFPFITVVEDFIPEGKLRAGNVMRTSVPRTAPDELSKLHPDLKGKKFKGIFFPLGIQPWGTASDDIYGQTEFNAAYNLPLFRWYWEYTRDTTYLREHAYPYHKLMADWWEDYLVKENFNGSYRYSIMGGLETPFMKNMPQSIAVIRGGLEFLLKYSSILKRDADKRAKWQEILDHMSEMPTSGKLSHEVIFPFEYHNLFSSSDILNNAKTNYRNDVDIFWHNFIGRDCIAGPRMGVDGEVMWKTITTILKLQLKANLTMDDQDHGIEKAAATEMFHSMMLQSVNEVLTIYPAWPKSKKGVFKSLLAKGAFLVSADYDDGIKNIVIKSEKGGICKILKPWMANSIEILELMGSNVEKITYTTSKDTISFLTKPGASYKFGSSSH